MPPSRGQVGFAPLPTLRARRDFLAANGGLRLVTPAFILLVRKTGGETRVGFTVSKRIGNAVARNRAKRRLREAARLEMPGAAITGADHVLIARPLPVERPFEDLRSDLARALARAANRLEPPE